MQVPERNMMRPLTVVEHVKLAAYFVANFRRADAFVRADAAVIRAYQLAHIKSLIAFAYREVPFYRAKYSQVGLHPSDIRTWDDFAKVPTVSKAELVAQAPKDLLANRKRNDHLIVSRSSGSSGVILDVRYDGSYVARQRPTKTRMFKHAFGLSPFDKQINISTSHYPYRSIAGLYKINYVHSRLSVPELIDSLVASRPDFVRCLPSLLLEMVKHRMAGELSKLTLKAVSTNSEYSSQLQRDYLANFFGCPVFDEYSSEELSTMALQCQHQAYHLQEDLSYVEITDTRTDSVLSPKEIGEITGTSLINNVMPFIRYRQGDLASVDATTQCRCGSRTRIFTNISGRRNAEFTCRDGRKIPSARLLDWTYELVLQHKLPALQFQLVQTSLTEVQFKFVPFQAVPNEQFQRIAEDTFRHNFGGEFSLVCEPVESVEKTEAGKHLPIRSLVESRL